MRRFVKGLAAGALALVLSATASSAAERTQEAPPPAPGLAVATFAGGCF